MNLRSEKTQRVECEDVKMKILRTTQIIIAFFLAIVYFITVFRNLSVHQKQVTLGGPDSLCPLVDKLSSSEYAHDNATLLEILNCPAFRNSSLSKLLGAVQVPTELYDSSLLPHQVNSLKELYEREPLWRNFEKFNQYLEETFPKTHKYLKREKINEFGLVYTWQGSDPELKPLMLAAHIDVVPVQIETKDDWTYPPFKGGYDGQYAYGRGVSDCKNLLVGLMETIELLLSENTFMPSRTVILAFGYDEESSGSGAKFIAEHLLSRYGPDLMIQIIDEGNSGFIEQDGLNFILPATGEKGYVDSIIELFTPGGHSSVPPNHTTIGILSRLIVQIEDNPFSSVLTNANPVLNQLQCVAEYSSTIDDKLRSDILRANLDPNAQKRLVAYLDENLDTRFLIKTSQAVDMVLGGAKANALPEHAQVLVDHRIAVESSVDQVSHTILEHILDIAHQFDLGVIFENTWVREPSTHGYFNYTLKDSLEPAPLSPVGGMSWNVFGGALRYLYEDLIGHTKNENETFIMAPFLSTGNTDTKNYWDLSKNIYRYQPGTLVEDGHEHSVDERINFDGHLAIIAFYHYYIQLVDRMKDSTFEA